MFFEVGIHENKQQTGVKELSNEDTIGNRCESCTVSIFTDPCEQTDS